MANQNFNNERRILTIMPNIDKNGALHAANGQYTFKPGTSNMSYDLDEPQLPSIEEIESEINGPKLPSYAEVKEAIHEEITNRELKQILKLRDPIDEELRQLDMDFDNHYIPDTETNEGIEEFNRYLEEKYSDTEKLKSLNGRPIPQMQYLDIPWKKKPRPESLQDIMNDKPKWYQFSKKRSWKQRKAAYDAKPYGERKYAEEEYMSEIAAKNNADRVARIQSQRKSSNLEQQKTYYHQAVAEYRNSRKLEPNQLKQS